MERTKIRAGSRYLGIAAAAVALLGACTSGGGSGGGGGGGGGTGGEQTSLDVTPTVPFDSAGAVGGPFAPASMVYDMSNTGSSPLLWTASANQNWIALSSAGGALDASGLTALVVSIDQNVAGSMSVGNYSGVVTITDVGLNESVTRSVTLSITAPSMTPLEVSPTAPLLASGVQGGPFSPATVGYTITNTGTSSVNWTASDDQSWLTLSSTSGALGAGAQATVDVSIDQGVAAGLGLGTHVGIVTITDVGVGETKLRQVSLRVDMASGGGNTATTLSQFGITWDFDGAYEVGQFANGDWWVVGPVTIVGITPKSTSGGARQKNGSMVNPSPRDGQTQGYDSTMYAQYRVAGNYSGELNVADDVSPTNTLTLPAGKSLVSTISEPDPDVRPQVKSAAILTVLSSAPAVGAFRPPYSGSDKTIKFNESQLDYGLLEKLAPVGSMVSMAEATRMFERPWLDHVPLWIGRYIHPVDNMPNYGREMADNIGVGAVMLHMDFSNAQKRDLLVGFVQLGIDFYGITQDGGKNNWPPSAGHMHGRKWPILFAGIMLGDPDMGGVGFDSSIQFGEDGQCFYVAETSPGVYNYGFGGYNAGDVGMPDWGTSHSYKPSYDDKNWNGDPYRQCCSANAWWGQLFAAHVMGAVPLWNQDAVFDYQDRYLTEMRQRNVLDWRLSWRDFYLDVWDAYRANY